MNYNEPREASKQYKINYANSFDNLIEKRQQAAKAQRREYITSIFKDQERYREDFKKMLGWPLVGYTAEKLPDVKSEKLSEEDDYTIYRMQAEVLEDFTMTGLFFKANGNGKKPLIIAQHGGWGTPELIGGFYGGTSNYNDMLQRVQRHGVHIFAPQLLLWHDDYGVPYDRKAVDAKLKSVGSSVTAVEIYGIMRILDYFEAKDYISNFGMVGLSYGGFYTLFTAAADTRIKSAISCSFFNKRDAVAWSDWMWQDAAYKFDDAEIACLVYPRRLCIEIGNQDDLFDAKYGRESFETIKEICREVGTDWTELIVFDGKHEFCRSDAPIERLVRDLNG